MGRKMNREKESVKIKRECVMTFKSSKDSESHSGLTEREYRAPCRKRFDLLPLIKIPPTLAGHLVWTPVVHPTRPHHLDESESESKSALFAKCVQTHKEFVVVF